MLLARRDDGVDRPSGASGAARDPRAWLAPVLTEGQQLAELPDLLATGEPMPVLVENGGRAGTSDSR